MIVIKLQGGGVAPGMTNIRKLAACTTYGGTRWRAMMTGDPPRKNFMRATRFACGMPPTRYVALYDMNNNGPNKLTAHLARVKAEMLKL